MCVREMTTKEIEKLYYGGKYERETGIDIGRD